MGQQQDRPTSLQGKVITVQAAALRLDVSESTIIRMIQDEDLAGMKVRGTWRVMEQSLEHYLREQASVPAADAERLAETTRQRREQNRAAREAMAARLQPRLPFLEE